MWIVITFVILFNIAELILIVCTYHIFPEDWRTWVISIDNSSVNILLVCLYAYTILNLMAPMNELSNNSNSFVKQRKSVLLQFAFFEFSFVGILFV